MMSEEQIPLSRSYPLPDGQPFDSITLREPTYAEMFMSGLGKPEEWQPTGRGTAARVVYPEVIDAYLKRIVVSPGYEYIHQISARDAVKLERAVCGFFRELTD